MRDDKISVDKLDDWLKKHHVVCGCGCSEWVFEADKSGVYNSLFIHASETV